MLVAFVTGVLIGGLAGFLTAAVWLVAAFAEGTDQ